MISFLKTVLIILLVYLGLKFLFRLLGPYLMRYVAKKAAQRFERSFGQSPFSNDSAQSREVHDIPKKNKSKEKVVGEYIDFEEID